MVRDKDIYSQMEKNTVDSKDQLKDSACVRFINPDGKGRRVMFVGNSITLHGILPSIGWYNEWGMAASKKENDYVHILMDRINGITPDSRFCICQVAEWERNYKAGETVYSLYENARHFNADMIVVRLIENCPKDGFDPEVFKKEFDALLGFLNKSRKAELILTTGFWRHPGDSTIVEYANERGLPCVELGDLGESDEMKAVGLFEHSGVAAHPGDTGMKTIAERIFGAIAGITAERR
ncbi:MAG: hypothetical protein E7460_04080 [Ruminococcaceae bacterium]|nr:hypothetical protein [Oscillospiraceae bacterium]